MFSSRTRKLLTFCLLVLVALAGCSREGTSSDGAGIKRIGVLVFENLSSDTSLDWMGRAIAGVISTQLRGQRSTMLLDLQSLRDADSARVSELIQGYYTADGDRLQLTVHVRDSNALTNIKTISVTASRSAGLLSLVDSVARQIDSSAHPYSTHNEQAVRELSEAAAATNSDAALSHVELAVNADPAFGPANLARIEMLLARHAPEAKAALEQAAQHSKSFSDADRAKLEVLRSTFDGSREERAAALSRLAAALPTDLATWEALASVQLTSKNFGAAAKAYESALGLEPDSISLLNSLAYAQAFAGNLQGARNAIASYRKLAPQDANTFDTLAEINYAAGNFAEAERNFMEAYQRDKALVNGAELYRAAVAAVLAGNRKAADEHWNAYVAGLKGAGDQLAPVRQALWAYQTGDASALDQLRKIAGQKEVPADVVSIAHSQIAIWLMKAGEPDRAREEAAKARSLASSAGAKAFAGTTSFLTEPNASASEWKARIERAAPGQPAIQRQMLGYALLLAKQYEDVIPVWKEIYDTGGLEVMGEPKTYLAYAYVMAGQKQQAATLMKTGVLPPKSLDPGIPSLLLPDYLLLKSRLQ